MLLVLKVWHLNLGNSGVDILFNTYYICFFPVLFGNILPAIFIIAVGNGMMYSFIAVYRTLQLHEYRVP
jgi:hypothetical protein